MSYKLFFRNQGAPSAGHRLLWLLEASITRLNTEIPMLLTEGILRGVFKILILFAEEIP